jgi:arsenate reductase
MDDCEYFCLRAGVKTRQGVKSMKTILFVCVHNSGRSQMAEAFFNQMAIGKALAYSAGTQPADNVNPVVVEAMREVGIDISGNKSKALTLDMVEKADKMITMGCGAEAQGVCPASFIETEDWALEDPKGKSLEQVRKIRDEIKDRVTRLVEQIIPKQES